MIRPHRLFLLIIPLALLTSLLSVDTAYTQSRDHEVKKAEPPKIRYRFSYTPLYQFETDLDSGGSFDVERHFLRLDASRSVAPQWIVGVGLSFDYERWNFSAVDGLAGIDPWDEIFRPGVSIPLIYNTANRWRLMAVPTLEFSGASGAETSESLSYGAVLSAMHGFGPNLTLGFGAGIFDRLDEWEVFPFVAVDWKINDRFRLSNPFRAGPAGPAGLELAYTPSERWDAGVGGAYRSYRFRLDDSSAVADGIGEMTAWTAFLRIGWRIGRHYQVDFNGGALIDGKLSIDDEDGNELGETGYDTAPFVGLTLRGQF